MYISIVKINLLFKPVTGWNLSFTSSCAVSVHKVWGPTLQVKWLQNDTAVHTRRPGRQARRFQPSAGVPSLCKTWEVRVGYREGIM